MLNILYHCETQCAAHIVNSDQQILGALHFEQTAELLSTANYAAIHQHVAMPILGDGDDDVVCEVFHESGPLQEAQYRDIHYRYSDDILFGVLALQESDYVACGADYPLRAASKMAYEQIFSVLKKENFPYALRFWNYMADINGITHGLERYRQFNLGRQQAFDNLGSNGTANLPAACALGMHNGPLTITFLAGRAPSIPIENPRQVSAYDYPAQYGPRSPLFSRASIATIDRKKMLFLSGTASIVGHETLHTNDVAAQTQESITNIEAVLTEAGNKLGTTCKPADLEYLVYIRHAKDVHTVRAVLKQRIGPNLKAFYLQADICRSDLLVEIEGATQLRS
jgi:enamine deaminase RidA (YjgF/YER057c/UK114 family)